MNECAFCRIVEGSLPSAKIFENSKVLGFLDIHPGTRGHSLVIPKQHFQNIYDVSEDELKEVISACKKIAVALKKSLNADGINIHQSNEAIAGQVVFHLHFHIFPRFNDDNQSFKWNHTEYKEGEKERLAETIKNALNK